MGLCCLEDSPGSGLERQLRLRLLEITAPRGLLPPSQTQTLLIPRLGIWAGLSGQSAAPL